MKLFTLNRQLFNRDVDQNGHTKISDIESHSCSYHITEIQEKIRAIQHNFYIDNKDKPVLDRGYAEIVKRGMVDRPFKDGNVYAFNLYSKNTICKFWVEYHELKLSDCPMNDNDLW
jgi:hypothetical protein